jgi:hypothetical protein
MKCTICGSDISQDDKVCPICGASLTVKKQNQTVSGTVLSGDVIYQQDGYQQQIPSQLKGDPNKDSFAIAALVMSILGFFCCNIAAILGIVFGILGLKSQKHDLALVSIIISGVAFVLSLISTIFSLLMIANGTFNDYFNFDGFYSFLL